MKTIVAVATSLFFALGASAQCVDGFREQIDYQTTFEHKCNYYRNGVRYDNIQSTQQCALLCVAQNKNYCSYSGARKICLVAGEDSPEKRELDVVLLTKVKVEDNPWDKSCEEKKAELQSKLDRAANEAQDKLSRCTAQRDELQGQRDEFQGQIAELQRQLGEFRLNSTAPNVQCPQSDGQDVKVGGSRWRIFCGRRWALFSPLDVASNVTEMAECLRLCSERNDCSTAALNLSQRTCILRGFVSPPDRIPAYIGQEFITGIRYWS